MQALGQTCWSLTLAHFLGKADVLFGTVLSGRETEDAEGIMFPTMNTVPIRAIAHGSYKDMLRYMQDNSGIVRKFQHTPLREMQKQVKNRGSKLFDTLFIYQRGNESDQVSEQRLYRSIGGSADLEVSIIIFAHIESMLTGNISTLFVLRWGVRATI